MKTLLRAAGVVDEHGRIDTFAEFQSSTLGPFMDAAELHVQEIGLVLGVRVRDDLREKPMLQLSNLLKMIGLKTTRKAVNKGAKKIYEYRLDLDSLETIDRYQKVLAKHLRSVRVHINQATDEAMMFVVNGEVKRKNRRPSVPKPSDRNAAVIPFAPITD